MTDFRVLAVRQPWADMLVPSPELVEQLTTHEVRWLPKNIENRWYGTDYRGLVIIHASLEPDQHAMTVWGLDPKRFVYGHAVGVVQLDDIVIGHPSNWAETDPDGRRRNWVVSNPRRLTPIKYSGNLGLRTPEPWLVDAVLEQIGAVRP